MMWKVFRRPKSWSETRDTAEEAVVEWLPLTGPKAVERREGDKKAVCVLGCKPSDTCAMTKGDGSNLKLV